MALPAAGIGVHVGGHRSPVPGLMPGSTRHADGQRCAPGAGEQRASRCRTGDRVGRRCPLRFPGPGWRRSCCCTRARRARSTLRGLSASSSFPISMRATAGSCPTVALSGGTPLASWCPAVVTHHFCVRRQRGAPVCRPPRSCRPLRTAPVPCSPRVAQKNRLLTLVSEAPAAGKNKAVGIRSPRLKSLLCQRSQTPGSLPAAGPTWGLMAAVPSTTATAQAIRSGSWTWSQSQPNPDRALPRTPEDPSMTAVRLAWGRPICGDGIWPWFALQKRISASDLALVFLALNVHRISVCCLLK